jgi:hypothetical protein
MFTRADPVSFDLWYFLHLSIPAVFHLRELSLRCGGIAPGACAAAFRKRSGVLGGRMVKVDAGMAMNERPVSLAMLVATFLYRSEGCRNTLRYATKGLASTSLLIAAIRFQSALAGSRIKGRSRCVE